MANELWLFNGTVPTPDVMQRRMGIKWGIMKVYSGRICQETVRILANFWTRLEPRTVRIRTIELATNCVLHSYENSGLTTDPAGSSDQKQRHSISEVLHCDHGDLHWNSQCSQINNGVNWKRCKHLSATSRGFPAHFRHRDASHRIPLCDFSKKIHQKLLK